MCRKIVGSGMLSAILFTFAVECGAQNVLPESVISTIEQLADDSSSAEELVLFYESLLDSPVNINSSSREDLEKLRLLSLFQIESLIEYREKYGALRSVAELSLVDGFSRTTIDMLKSFITFDAVDDDSGKWSDTFTTKFKKNWHSEGFSLTVKDFFDSNQLSAGIVIDNDPKEKFPDFISSHIRWKHFYAGDFVARFGQGLVCWKAFPMSVFGAPSSTSKRGNGLQGYRSTDEANFFRGVGFSNHFGNTELSLFVSRNALDARVIDSCYTSIVTGGVHTTESEIAKRHSMHEYVAGANVSQEYGHWRFGMTAICYCYDKKNGRKVQSYNKYQQYDGLWGNVGADFYGSYRSFRFFGEVAIDAHLAPAIIAGMIWSPSYNFETSLTGRCYSPSYISTHSGAYSSVSSTSNQIGASLAVKAIVGKFTATANADYAYYPWERYRLEAGTSSFKSRLLLQYDVTERMQFQLQAYYNNLLRVRLQASCAVADSWTFASRVEGNRGGYVCYGEVRWRSVRGKLQISARVTRYDVADWDSRIYVYEGGMPQSFSVEAYSGNGFGEYLVVKYSPSRRVDMSIKLNQKACAYFVRIFIPG